MSIQKGNYKFNIAMAEQYNNTIKISIIFLDNPSFRCNMSKT